MAKKPSQKQAQKALDKHLSTVNEITEAEKDQLKVVKDLAKAMGESVKDNQELLKIKEKTRSLEQQLLDTIDDYNLTQDESVKIAQKALDMKQKEIARQKE